VEQFSAAQVVQIDARRNNKTLNQLREQAAIAQKKVHLTRQTAGVRALAFVLVGQMKSEQLSILLSFRANYQRNLDEQRQSHAERTAKKYTVALTSLGHHLQEAHNEREEIEKGIDKCQREFQLIEEKQTLLRLNLILQHFKRRRSHDCFSNIRRGAEISHMRSRQKAAVEHVEFILSAMMRDDTAVVLKETAKLSDSEVGPENTRFISSCLTFLELNKKSTKVEEATGIIRQQLEADFTQHVNRIDVELSHSKTKARSSAAKEMRMIVWRFCKTVIDTCLHDWRITVRETHERDLQDGIVALSKKQSLEVASLEEEKEFLLNEVEIKEQEKHHHAGSLILRSVIWRFLRQVIRRCLDRWLKAYKDDASALLVERLLQETMGPRPAVVL